VWAAVVAAGLWDLSRHDVQRLPKWAWALIIAFAAFPVGPIVYWIAGRADAEHASLATPATTTPWSDEAVHATMPREPDLDAPPVVTTDGLSKSFGQVSALDAVDLRVPRGVTYGLIGPNGAGKTTLLSILGGLRRADAGSVALDVQRGAVSLLPDTPQFEPWLTAREVVALALRLARDRDDPHAVADVLARSGLREVADRRVGGFSRGMLQRLGLATCLVTDPELLILDEPSSALDPAGRRAVLDLIRQLTVDRTVILSTHILGDVQRVADVVGVLDGGRLRFQGPIRELLARTGSALDLTVRDPSGTLLHALRSTPWIARVEDTAPGTLRLHVTDLDVAERALPRLLADLHTRVVSLNPVTDLESAFLTLTEAGS
jgi:ABC-2 type transport system ATP-binding protein